jgi:hypothetical protein
MLIKITAGVIATVALYSVLWRENKAYRFFEHIFLGLAAGFSIVALWRDILEEVWWSNMVGQTTTAGDIERAGNWLYAILIPVGLMAYFVFSKQNNWMSRIPIGIILGFWSGQQVEIWFRQWGPQIYNSMLPVVPTATDRWTVPADVGTAIYPAQALSNLIFVLCVLTALSYFFFSFDLKNKVLKATNTTGRWVLMVGFGAIFGATVMARFALVIDRMFFVWIQWLRGEILEGLFGVGAEPAGMIILRLTGG